MALQEWMESLREVERTPWRPVGTPAAVALGILFALVAWFDATARPVWVPVLDSVNLIFHESGHPVFGLLPGETIAILGGTLMQLAVPLMVGGSFWWKRQAAGFGFAGFWLFQNFHNIAAYMADARAQELTSCLSSAARSATDEHVVGLGVCCTATMFWCLLRVTCSVRRCGANRRQRCSRNVI